jgi:hypothetical protein
MIHTCVAGFCRTAAVVCRLSINDPPTALVGFAGPKRVLCRLSMNDPPTALVGFAGPKRVLCRLTMKDPPTALVGFAGPKRGAFAVGAKYEQSTNCVGGIRDCSIRHTHLSKTSTPLIIFWIPRISRYSPSGPFSVSLRPA